MSNAAIADRNCEAPRFATSLRKEHGLVNLHVEDIAKLHASQLH